MGYVDIGLVGVYISSDTRGQGRLSKGSVNGDKEVSIGRNSRTWRRLCRQC
jgi:hypothetical protein